MPKLLNEMPWITVKPVEFPTSTGRRVPVDMVDPRIEDMIRRKFIPFVDPYGKWYGVLPGADQVLTANGLADPSGDMAGWVRLPDGWWQFAYGMYRDKNVKASAYPRAEQGEADQESLDRELDGMKLEERLRWVMGV